MRFAISNICTAFQERTIGSKVLPQYHNSFLKLVEEELLKIYDSMGDMVTIVLPPKALEFISAGVAAISNQMIADDFVVRKFRGSWRAFAKRRHAIKAESVSVCVYDRAAYLKDPDILPQDQDTPEVKAAKETEFGRIMYENPDYVIVAVLAGTGMLTPYGGKVLIHNIAGGNNEFIPMTDYRMACSFLAAAQTGEQQFKPEVLFKISEDLLLLHKIINLCKESEQYEDKYIVVAD